MRRKSILKINDSEMYLTSNFSLRPVIAALSDIFTSYNVPMRGEVGDKYVNRSRGVRDPKLNWVGFEWGVAFPPPTPP